MEENETNMEKDLSRKLENNKNNTKISGITLIALFFSLSFFILLIVSLILDSFITYDKMKGFWSTLLIYIGRPWQLVSVILCILSTINYLTSKRKETTFTTIIILNIIINIISTSVILMRKMLWL